MLIHAYDKDSKAPTEFLKVTRTYGLKIGFYKVKYKVRKA